MGDSTTSTHTPSLSLLLGAIVVSPSVFNPISVLRAHQPRDQHVST